MSEVFHKSNVEYTQDGISRAVVEILEECEVTHFKGKQVALLRNIQEGVSVVYDQVVASMMRSIRLMGGHVTVIGAEGYDASGEEALQVKKIPDGTVVKEVEIEKIVSEADLVCTVSNLDLHEDYGFTASIANAALQGKGQSLKGILSQLSEKEKPIALAELAAVTIRNHERFHVLISTDIQRQGEVIIPGLGLFATYDMVALDELVGNLINEIPIDERYFDDEAKRTLQEARKDMLSMAEALARPWDMVRKLNHKSHWQATLHRADGMSLGNRLYAHIKDGVVQRN